jgi:hypothetical protein
MVLKDGKDEAGRLGAVSLFSGREAAEIRAGPKARIDEKRMLMRKREY